MGMHSSISHIITLEGRRADLELDSLDWNTSSIPHWQFDQGKLLNISVPRVPSLPSHFNGFNDSKPLQRVGKDSS